MSVRLSVSRITNARDLTKSAMRTTTTASSVAETVVPMTVAARDVTTVISTVPIQLQSVTGVLTSVVAGTTTIAMLEISVTRTPMFASLNVWRTTNARDLTKSAMRTTTTASSVAETVVPMTVAVRDVTTVISTVRTQLQSVTGLLTSVVAGTIMTAMLEISVTLTPMFARRSVWRTRSVWASTRSVMRTTTTASTAELETAKHLSAAVQDATTVISTVSTPRQSVWEITPVDVSQTLTAMPETSVTRTPMLARKSQTSARLMLTVMRD